MIVLMSPKAIAIAVSEVPESPSATILGRHESKERKEGYKAEACNVRSELHVIVSRQSLAT
jgi:hypothetical protein